MRGSWTRTATNSFSSKKERDKKRHYFTRCSRVCVLLYHVLNYRLRPGQARHLFCKTVRFPKRFQHINVGYCSLAHNWKFTYKRWWWITVELFFNFHQKQKSCHRWMLWIKKREREITHIFFLILNHPIKRCTAKRRDRNMEWAQ